MESLLETTDHMDKKFVEYVKNNKDELLKIIDYNRNYLRAVNTSINNKKKNFNAWIDLYKAVGGGFAIKSPSVNVVTRGLTRVYTATA